MKSFPAPKGFIFRSLPSGCGWFRPKLEKSIRAAWEIAGSGLRFSTVARRNPSSRQHAGRLPVYSATFPGAGDLVVRPCAHGGWWGRLARDLYPDAKRAQREIETANRLEAVKIPTPKIEAVLFYPAGPFVRIEVVTRLIPEGLDLVQRLRSRLGPAERGKLFSAVRRLFRQLHQHGIHHTDLNARNILISLQQGYTAWLLDVDAVRFANPHSPSVKIANRNRLLRSLLKRSRLGDLGWSELEVAKLWRELFPLK